MVQTRTFRVVLSGEGHGTGTGQSTYPDKIVQYSGEQVTIAP
jgi:hypothetical protein